MARDRLNADDEVCSKRRDDGHIGTNITKQTVLSEMQSRRSQRSRQFCYAVQFAVHNEADSFAV